VAIFRRASGRRVCGLGRDGAAKVAAMKESAGRIEFVTLMVNAAGGALSLPIPKDVSHALGSRARVEVKGTVNGKPMRAPAMPDGKGGHSIGISREMQDLFGARVGERVKVVLELIAQDAPVEAPPDMNRVLQHNLQAKAHWEKFAPPQRRAWVQYVDSSRKPEERQRRISEAVQRIALGKTP
jgi:hypothetical protein